MRDYLISRGAVDEVTAFVDAVKAGEVRKVEELLGRSASLREQINRPLFSFGAQAILLANENRELVDVLLKHGADINVRSQWAPGGFGILDGASPEDAAYLISRGAHVDFHAACHLGMLDRVKALIASDPSLINAKGGDGQRPLHFASTKEIIDHLLDHGADIDARDIDHNATAAQYAVDAEWKCRYLIERGAAIDIFMAAALGDATLVERALREHPDALSARIGHEDGYEPTARGAAGHIYCWKLGGGLSPHDVALRRGHGEVFDLMMSRSPLRVRFLRACSAADEAGARDALRQQPDLVATLTPDESQILVAAADRRDPEAIHIMLDAGIPVDAVNGEGMTALERAALRGFVDVVRLLCRRGASLTHRHNYDGDALDTCLWGSLNFKDRSGDYPETVQVLIAAGARVPEKAWGSDEVKQVLVAHRAKE